MYVVVMWKEWLLRLLFDLIIFCDDFNSILWDVMKDCSDLFFVNLVGLFWENVSRIY